MVALGDAGPHVNEARVDWYVMICAVVMMDMHVQMQTVVRMM